MSGVATSMIARPKPVNDQVGLADFAVSTMQQRKDCVARACDAEAVIKEVSTV